ncbi:MAG: YbjN domain-containing protein [Polyangiaceae bacterium]
MLVDTRKIVEAVFTKLGLKAESLLVSEASDRVVYQLRRGSADVLVVLAEDGEGDAPSRGYVRIVAPVMVPPPDDDVRLRLFERLLSLNASGLHNAAFGFHEGKVIVVSERPSAHLEVGEVEQMVKHLSAVADTFDDRLVKEFGGKRASDA